MKCPNCRVRSGRKTSQICLILAPFLTNPFPSEEFLGQRDDDASRASHVAEPVLVLVLGHLADEFGAIGAQANDSVVDAFDGKHDAPEAQRVRRCDRRFDLDQFWIAKLVSSSRPCPSGVRIITIST